MNCFLTMGGHSRHRQLIHRAHWPTSCPQRMWEHPISQQSIRRGTSLLDPRFSVIMSTACLPGSSSAICRLSSAWKPLVTLRQSLGPRPLVASGSVPGPALRPLTMLLFFTVTVLTLQYEVRLARAAISILVVWPILAITTGRLRHWLVAPEGGGLMDRYRDQ